jgi:hypothetical protein
MTGKQELYTNNALYDDDGVPFLLQTRAVFNFQRAVKLIDITINHAIQMMGESQQPQPHCFMFQYIIVYLIDLTKVMQRCGITKIQ